MIDAVLLNEEVAERACQVAEAAFLKLVELGLANKEMIHIVVMDPSTSYGSCEFDMAVLYEHNVNNAPDKYRQIALHKAFVSWRTGMDSHQVQRDAPYLYQEGDVKWGGSVVCDGLIVAASGVQWVFDYMTCEVVVAAIKAHCRLDMENIVASEELYLGGYPALTLT